VQWKFSCYFQKNSLLLIELIFRKLMGKRKRKEDRLHRCGILTRGGTACRRRVKKAHQRCHLHQKRPGQTALQAGVSSTREDVPVVVVNQLSRGDKFKLLRDALEQAGFWECIEARRKCCLLSKTDFRIIIKPDLEFFDVGTPTGTDPEIVEHLIALLHRRGYEQVAVCDALCSADLWLENRDVAVLADLVGYRYVTEDGRDYDVLNLSEDVIEGGFAESGVLYGSKLGRAWLEAHFRISFAKNKTHEEYFFSLGLQNLLGVLPLRDKEYHYYHRFDSGDVCLELLDKTPVHFSIIDALISNHGSDGMGTVNPLSTNTLIASENLLLADWAAALKMGVDPYASPLNAKALHRIGLPRRYKIKGDLSPYPDWKNVPLILSDSVRKRNSSVSVRQIVRPWFQSVNRELFPFKNSVDEQLNYFIGSFLSRLGRHPMALLVRVGLNYILAATHNLVQYYEILYDKERVRRKQTSLGLDLDKYKLSDYEAIVDYMQPLAQIATQTPADRNGLRWRYIDRSVLFEFTRSLPIGYEQFVSRVDISAAVRMMNDNIGGACVPVATDHQGRITHQAERNIYLPQPNWMVVFSGKVIDVGKLEFIRYEEDRHQIFWRTVTSVNNSALFDDGIVTFGRDEAGKTAITIVARQEFTLPLFWQVINMDFVPQVKDTIVSDAYTNFFSRTIANFEASFEGRTVDTGRSWNPNFGEFDVDNGKLPLEQIADAFVKLVGFIGPTLSNLWNNKNASAEDGNGFRYFKEYPDTFKDQINSKRFADSTANIVRPFFSDLFDAVKKDLNMINPRPKKDRQ
jgi:uncharacterized protein (DUF362 family)